MHLLVKPKKKALFHFQFLKKISRAEQATRKGPACKPISSPLILIPIPISPTHLQPL